jgi:tetrahydromethanopterin S-methyltransferase subunit B
MPNFLHFRKFIIPFGESDRYLLKVNNPSFKGVFLYYQTKALYENKQNYSKNPRKICKEHIMSSFIAAYMRKNHFLAIEIDKKIESFKSNGMLERWIKKYTKHENNAITSNSVPSKLELSNLQGAFEILIYGLVVSLIILALELIYIKFKNFFD